MWRRSETASSNRPASASGCIEPVERGPEVGAGHGVNPMAASAQLRHPACGAWSAMTPRIIADRSGQLLEQRPSSQCHLEVALGHTAIRAGPRFGDVLPAGAGRDALVGQSLSLVIDEAADDTHPGAVGNGGHNLIHRILSSVGILAPLSHPVPPAGSTEQ